MTIKIDLSYADAKQLLVLLETSDTFPDVVEELRSAIVEAVEDERSTRKNEEERQDGRLED